MKRLAPRTVRFVFYSVKFGKNNMWACVGSTLDVYTFPKAGAKLLESY